jgi:type IV secretory pathway VirJ component
MKQLIAGFLCTLGLISGTFALQDSLRFGNFGTVSIYLQDTHPAAVVLFISGDGGWNQGVVEMARSLSKLDALVAGFSIVHYEKELATSPEKCSYPAGDFEMLSKYIQKKYGFSAYIPPILVGYSSGATLAYATIVQAPSGTFKGAISLGFCRDLPLDKPLCAGGGQLKCEQCERGKAFCFFPHPELNTPWIAFQGTVDQVCNPDSVVQFVKQIPSAKLMLLPKVGHGFSVEKNWMPQFKQAFESIASSQAGQQPAAPEPAAKIADLPVVEVPATGTPKNFFAILLTGDGGWAGIDKELAAELAASGVSVAGLNTLQYFWKPRTPESTSADVQRIANYYRSAWKKDNVALVGYSLGADVLPFVYNRLPQGMAYRVKLIALLGLSTTADFQFHLSDWIGGAPGSTARAVLPELQKITGKKLLCIYGSDEKDTPARDLDTTKIRVLQLPGGHHFGQKYDVIAREILKDWEP